MWYDWEHFTTKAEAIRYAANEMLAAQAKRIERIEKGESAYREGFRWAVQVPGLSRRDMTGR